MHRIIPNVSVPLLCLALCSSLRAQTPEISARAYAVLSAFLRIQLEGQDPAVNFRVGPKGYVITPFTDPSLRLTTKEGEGLRSRLTGLKSDTLESFERCADERMTINKKFDLPVAYQMVPPEEAKDILKMDRKDMGAWYEHRPDAMGIIQFSCVGLNPTGTQALFFVQRVGHYSKGEWIFMEMNESGNWVQREKLVKWMSRNLFGVN
jgi:hypothetical protein